ncbi:MAG: TonB-dependent receptor, partial [Pyrinomonadaceae bacterium]
GSIFGYIGSQKLNARSTSEDGTLKNYDKNVRYGGTFGGPLPIFNFGEGGPMFNSGKNKLFFFGAYEKFFQEGSSSSGSFTSPTLAGINTLAAQPGVSQYVINLFRNSVALAPTTTSTRTVLGVPIGFGDVFLPIPAFQGQKSYQFNIDHLPNENNQIRYRYARGRYGAEGAGNGGLSFNNLSLYDTDLFSTNWIHTFGSNLINDLRLSYTRTIQDFPLKDPTLTDFPNLTVTDLNLLIGPSGNLPQSGYDNNYQVYDSLTFVTGSHTFKGGADFRRYLGGSDFLPRSRGDYFYSSLDVLIRDLAPDVVNIRGVGQGTFVSNNHRFFTFIQDDWKVRSNLAFNLGVRYEYQGLYRDAALQATAAPANIPGVIEFGVPAVDKNNFAPRLGVVWSPHFDNMIGRFMFGNQGDSSIRANFSRSFFPNFSNFALISLPPTLQGSAEFAGPATNFLAQGGSPGAFTPNLTPAFLRANAGSLILPQIVPYADSIAVSYQRQIGAANGLEIRYLRTRGKSLPVQVQLNSRPVVDAAMVLPTFLTAPTVAQVTALPTITQVIAANPIFAGANVAPRQLASQGFNGVITGLPTPIGSSKYDGLAVSLTRRFSK